MTDICRQCHERGTSCCMARSDDGAAMITPPVSGPEVQRIMVHLGHENQELVFSEKPNSVFYVRQMENLFPEREAKIKALFPPEGHHFELKTKDSACALLGANGCILPRAIRPHFCRIYPFWFFGEAPHIFQDPGCLALTSHRTVAEVFLSLGTTPETLKQIHERICLDLGLSPSRTQVELMSS